MSGVLKQAVKLSGVIHWAKGSPDDAFDVPVPRAILRGDSLVISSHTRNASYEIQLRRVEGDRFQGTATGEYQGNSATAEVTAALYSNDRGYAMVGRWVEHCEEWRWWAELRVVERFEDEAGE
ncbi:MAG: hypothetical protein QM775_34425 [Pirellulales bacterium]